MQKEIRLKLLPSEAADVHQLKSYIAQSAAVEQHNISGYKIIKSSIDARGRQPFVLLTLMAFINEPFAQAKPLQFNFQDVTKAHRKVVIIGGGPAGLFAALTLIEQGIQPILLERGKDVRARRRDLAILNKQGIVNSESNYCFGEGGAGTYSDGKLYTRSNKRGDINRILNILVRFGADERILYEAHPHIGTNKLPVIITAIRDEIVRCGGQFLFNEKVIDFTYDQGHISTVKTAAGNDFAADAFILATGHSARDIYTLLHNKKVLIEAKPFALGVRVEHPQTVIDSIQYHCNSRGEYLPPAAYSLVHQVDGKGVFSFCMCPGGIIAPACTDPGELVVNGWSPSKRNNPYANSGMVVSVEQKDLTQVPGFNAYLKNMEATIDSPLSLMYFQQMVEKAAYTNGGGGFVAPAQRLTDFCLNKNSSSLPECSYLPGVLSSNLCNTLPRFIHTRLQDGFVAFGKKMKGFYTNEAIVVATESRTSSPVRIPRHATTLQHPQLANLYPCAEGAGYAGGIVSAAMDGERIATIISQQ